MIPATVCEMCGIFACVPVTPAHSVPGI